MIASLFQSTEIWRSVGHLINESKLFTAERGRHIPPRLDTIRTLHPPFSSDGAELHKLDIPHM